ncbi:MAG: hypothetical protein ACXVXI_05260 [Mycobacteriaceae bacterium]
MTTDEKEQVFLRHVESTENYFAAVRANGNVPWFEDLEHLEKLEVSYPGISQRPGMEARRMFFTGRWTRPEPPEGLHVDPRTPQDRTEEIPA